MSTKSIMDNIGNKNKEYMKRYLFFFVCVFCFVQGYAQSTMTDEQILQFVQRERQAGTKDAQIVTKLVQRGVTVDKIRKMRDQYRSQLQG